jgi:hypothetical protein
MVVELGWGHLWEVRGQGSGGNARQRIYGVRSGKGESGGEGRAPVWPAMAGGWGRLKVRDDPDMWGPAASG